LPATHGPGGWRVFIAVVVDVLIGALFVVAYATLNGAADAAADLLDLLSNGVIALVGIGVMLEPR